MQKNYVELGINVPLGMGMRPVPKWVPMSRSIPTAPLYPDLSSSELPQVSSQSILERFSIAAVFVLATTLATSEPRSRAEDRELVQRVSSYYLDLGKRLPSRNHILKIGRVFQIMLNNLQLLSTLQLSTLLTTTPVPNDEDIKTG